MISSLGCVGDPLAYPKARTLDSYHDLLSKHEAGNNI